MKLLGLPLGELQTNCYILVCEKTNQAVVIDPGAEPDKLIKTLEELKVEVNAILLTHGHGDHIGAVEPLRQSTKAPLYVHENDRSMIQSAEQNFSSMMGKKLECTDPEYLVTEGDLIEIGEEIKLKVILTPGHTTGGVCYYEESGKLLFSGDTLFAESIGRTDFPGGSYDELIKRIKEGLMTLPDDVRVFPGHGPETAIGWEKKNNPFIR